MGFCLAWHGVSSLPQKKASQLYLPHISQSLICSAYIGLGKVYQLFMMMPHEEFREFTDPKNEVCQLLQAHFVAMQLIMTPISKVEWGKRKKSREMQTDGRTGRWLDTLHKAIPPHMREYYEWTLWVEERTSAIVNGFVND